jgi:hypothetical protein
LLNGAGWRRSLTRPTYNSATLSRRVYRHHFHLLNHIVLHVQDINIVLLNAHAGARRRDLFQRFQNHPVNGARFIFRQMPVKGFIEFTNVGAAVNQH